MLNMTKAVEEDLERARKEVVMSQVSKVDKCLEILEAGTTFYGQSKGDWDNRKAQATQALLAIVLEAKPEKYKPRENDKGTPGIYHDWGYNDALDEWEANIRKVFGVTE